MAAQENISSLDLCKFLLVLDRWLEFERHLSRWFHISFTLLHLQSPYLPLDQPSHSHHTNHNTLFFSGKSTTDSHASPMETSLTCFQPSVNMHILSITLFGTFNTFLIFINRLRSFGQAATWVARNRSPNYSMSFFWFSPWFTILTQTWQEA